MNNCTKDMLHYRYVKQVTKYGIPRPDAKLIVETAMEAGRGKDIEMYITYAVTLKYGLKLDENKVTI